MKRGPNDSIRPGAGEELGAGSPSTGAGGPSAGSEAPAAGGGKPQTAFLSSHAHILVCLAAHPDLRLRDVARRVNTTERTVQRVLSDLEREGLVERHRVGRRNAYRLHLDRALPHPLEKHRTVRELVELLLG